MRQERGTWINNDDAAKLRLAEWAAVFRYISHKILGGPGSVAYNQQSWVNGRVDHETIKAQIEMNERLERALETDGWIQEIRDEHPKVFEALNIYYYDKEPGGYDLTLDWRIASWRKRTGLGQARFYDYLNEGRRKIGLYLAVSDGF